MQAWQEKDQALQEKDQALQENVDLRKQWKTKAVSSPGWLRSSPIWRFNWRTLRRPKRNAIKRPGSWRIHWNRSNKAHPPRATRGWKRTFKSDFLRSSCPRRSIQKTSGKTHKIVRKGTVRSWWHRGSGRSTKNGVSDDEIIICKE